LGAQAIAYNRSDAELQPRNKAALFDVLGRPRLIIHQRPIKVPATNAPHLPQRLLPV
jgi:hypothetical protein